MKSIYPTAKRGREWAKHLRRIGKRIVNKGTRRICKKLDKNDSIEQ